MLEFPNFEIRVSQLSLFRSHPLTFFANQSPTRNYRKRDNSTTKRAIEKSQRDKSKFFSSRLHLINSVPRLTAWLTPVKGSEVKFWNDWYCQLEFVRILVFVQFAWIRLLHVRRVCMKLTRRLLCFWLIVSFVFRSLTCHARLKWSRLTIKTKVCLISQQPKPNLGLD